MKTKTPSVLNCLRRYAAAPSCTALAISCIFAVPWLAARTSRTSTPATARAASATTATITTHVRLPPLTLTGATDPPAARAGPSIDIRSPSTSGMRR